MSILNNKKKSKENQIIIVTICTLICWKNCLIPQTRYVNSMFH